MSIIAIITSLCGSSLQSRTSATLTQAIDRLLADPKLFSEVQETVSPASTRRMEHRTPVWMEKLADIQPAAVVQKS